MAPNYQVIENPVTLWSHKALRVFGRLVAQWSTDPDSRPSGAREEAGGRILVLSKDAFLAVLAGLDGDDALGDSDVAVREDISEVEIVLRQDGRASLLLPEPAAIAAQQAAAANASLRPAMQIARLYKEIADDPSWVGASFTSPPPLPDDECGLEIVKLESDDPMDAFIHPYMAAYLCTQCT